MIVRIYIVELLHSDFCDGMAWYRIPTVVVTAGREPHCLRVPSGREIRNTSTHARLKMERDEVRVVGWKKVDWLDMQGTPDTKG